MQFNVMTRKRPRALESHLLLEFKPMFRASICSAVVAALVSIGADAALAQTPSSKHKSPGEMAAAGRLLAVKADSCRRQAREQNLSFFKRRRFVRDCVKDKP